MDFKFTDEEEVFRDEVRSFLRKNPYDQMKIEYEDQGYSQGGYSREFHKKLGEAGYLSLCWPTENGGRGAPLMKQFIMLEELTRAKAPITAINLVHTVSHLLIEHGTERAKREILPALGTGDIVFWLGFTEPDAGSDLLSLKTTAKHEADYFIINGQKSCSSYAGASDWVYLLVNTNPEGLRARNLSLILVDKKLPGVTVKPVLNLGGLEMHHDVFLDDVKVHQDYLIGEENQGFPYLLAGLESDRFWSARGLKAQWLEIILDEILCFIRDDPLGRELFVTKDSARDALATLKTEIEVSRLFAYRCASMLDQGRTLTYEAAALKCFVEEVSVRFWHTIVEILGPFGLLKNSRRFPFLEQLWYFYILSVPVSILAGGAAEIQKDTIARLRLGIKPTRQ